MIRDGNMLPVIVIIIAISWGAISRRLTPRIRNIICIGIAVAVAIGFLLLWKNMAFNTMMLLTATIAGMLAEKFPKYGRTDNGRRLEVSALQDLIFFVGIFMIAVYLYQISLY